MNNDPVIRETHVRTCRVFIRKADLERMVKEFALSKAGFQDFATTAKVSFPDATDGNPPYKVGTECTVDLTEDQTMLPRLAE